MSCDKTLISNGDSSRFLVILYEDQVAEVTMHCFTIPGVAETKWLSLLVILFLLISHALTGEIDQILDLCDMSVRIKESKFAIWHHSLK